MFLLLDLKIILYMNAGEGRGARKSGKEINRIAPGYPPVPRNDRQLKFYDILQ